MQHAKDPQRLDIYYNKRPGAEKITKILNLVNEQFLDGKAVKSQQKQGQSFPLAFSRSNREEASYGEP
jgi:alanyl-tRNA synthetase